MPAGTDRKTRPDLLPSPRPLSQGAFLYQKVLITKLKYIPAGDEYE